MSRVPRRYPVLACVDGRRLAAFSSSLESAIPASSAQSKKSVCRVRGKPRLAHISTAFSPSLKRLQTTSSPPKRSTISRTSSSMPTHYGTKSSNVKNFKFLPGMVCSNDKCVCPANNGTTSSRVVRDVARAQKRDWNERVITRLESLLADMEWTPDLLAHALHPNATRSASAFKTIKHHFERDRSMPAYTLYRTSELLGVSVAYLMCQSDDITAAITPMGLYDLERRKRAMKTRAN